MSETTNFQEILELVDNIPPLDDIKVKDADLHGKLADMLNWFATARQEDMPKFGHCCITLYIGMHGFMHDRKDHKTERDKAMQYFEACQDGLTHLNIMAERINSDLRVYELDTDNSTRNALEDNAMAEEDAAQALAYGMMSVEEEMDCYITSGFGSGSDYAAKAIIKTLHSSVSVKDELVDALAKQGTKLKNKPLDLLRAIGGFEIAALSGQILACNLAKSAVILDGYAALAAASLVHALNPELIRNCAVADSIQLKDCKKAINAMGLPVLSDHGSDLGYGTAGSLVIPTLETLLGGKEDEQSEVADPYKPANESG